MFNTYWSATNFSELMESANPPHQTVGAVSTMPSFPGPLPIQEGCTPHFRVYYVCRNENLTLAAAGTFELLLSRPIGGNLIKIAEEPSIKQYLA